MKIIGKILLAIVGTLVVTNLISFVSYLINPTWTERTMTRWIYKHAK